MDVLSASTPASRKVTQSGTFAANPLTMAASLAFLEYVEAHPEGYTEIAARTERVRQAIRMAAAEKGLPLAVNGTASMLQMHAGVEKIENYEDFARRDPEFRKLLFLHLALNGVFAPGPTGTFFFSWAHTDSDADRFVSLVTEFLDLWRQSSAS
jgi:glutamate-1-semialdehyde aminotransferase